MELMDEGARDLVFPYLKGGKSENGKCEKVWHGIGGEYWHMSHDDTPYIVEDEWYCGRCHGFVEKIISESKQIDPEMGKVVLKDPWDLFEEEE